MSTSKENKEVEQLKTEEIAQKDKELIEEKIEDNNQKTNIVTTSKKRAIILVVIIMIVLIALFSTIFALINATNIKILNGVSVNTIDISNLTREEAKNKLKEEITRQLEKDINMIYQEFETGVNPIQIEFAYDIDAAIDDAYKIGRQGNILQNNYEILKTLIGKQNVDIDYTYNKESLENIVSDIETKLPDAMKKYSYYIEDGKLILTPGKEGTTVQKERLQTLIIDSIQKRREEDKKITIPVQISQPEPIDIDKIHTEVSVEPQNAYYTTNPYKIYPHVVGIDFDVESAKTILQEPQESYTIQLNYTEPEITTNKIGLEAFPDLISSFSTKYDVTNRNRSTNLRLAAEKINGTILMPGEEFSYNKVVGERTIAAGYKEAKIYSSGQVVDGLGGGICQISSTLYNAILYANLDVTERRNHQFVTSYVKAGLDATVVYGSQDFKFVNSRQYPVKIVAEVKNGVAKVDVYGAKEEAEYEVRLEPVVINYIPFTTSYISDSSLEPGVEIVEQNGNNGVKTVTYKYLLLNGNIVSKETISNDTYNAMKKIIRIGE